MPIAFFPDKRLFIFDLDGTLVNAYHAIHDTLNRARKELGHSPVSYSEVKKSVGRGSKTFIYSFFTRAEVPRAIRIYREGHKEALRKHLRLRPHARQVLAALKKKGRRVAIASNRPRYSCEHILRITGLKRYVDYLLTGEDIGRLKPHPKILNTVIRHFGVNRKEAVYIGDMDIDLKTARRAGIDAVFIIGGSSDASDARRFRDVRLIRSLRSLIDPGKSGGRDAKK